MIKGFVGGEGSHQYVVNDDDHKMQFGFDYDQNGGDDEFAVMMEILVMVSMAMMVRIMMVFRGCRDVC